MRHIADQKRLELASGKEEKEAARFLDSAREAELEWQTTADKFNSLRKATADKLAELCLPPEAKHRIAGNAPSGHYAYKHKLSDGTSHQEVQYSFLDLHFTH
ncbi:unnamed protein product [Protopolystoma xenopodis]|uniref:Uncharacterized protein n=1 Tax=Protopolystoma xenopodis TaxID=117903 RepID=A0A448WSN9_9PLAT|nr:unnamed protein product [Protopolystoma xenopodis]